MTRAPRSFGGRKFLDAGLVLLTAGSALAKHEPPPVVIPTAETQQADELYRAGRYTDAVAAAKLALNKNERYTPAMLVMAKSYYKLHKYEWMKKLWEMMQANGASDAEKSDPILSAPRFLGGRREERPGRHRALQAGGRGAPRQRHPVEQPRRRVSDGEELRRCDAGAREVGPVAARLRQGSPELG